MKFVCTILAAFAFCSFSLFPTLVAAGTLHERIMPASSAPGSRERHFSIYVPDTAPDDGSAPLVTVLHGCKQTEDNMINETRFTDLADMHGFVVLFPFITSIPPGEIRSENCWGFWFPQQRTEGSGEVADIRRMIAAVESEFVTDPARRYVTGLSSGAAMAVDVGVAYSEDIAAIGTVAGLPYGEDSTAVSFVCGVAPATNSIAATMAAMAAEQDDHEEKRLVPLMVVHSINDCVVPIINGHNLRDSWLAYYNAAPHPVQENDCGEDGVPCTHRRFADANGKTVVETVFYTGAAGQNTHYWPGDNPGIFANPNGPSASQHLWAFFEDKSLAGIQSPILTIANVHVAGQTATISGAVNAETAIASVHVALEGESPQAAHEATLNDDHSWAVSFNNLPNDQFYTPVATATLEDGSSVMRTGMQFAIGNPLHILEEVATWQQHLAANRIRVQGTGCTSGTFGACDRDFTSLFFEHGFSPFPLYALAGSDRWFADADNVTGE